MSLLRRASAQTEAVRPRNRAYRLYRNILDGLNNEDAILIFGLRVVAIVRDSWHATVPQYLLTDPRGARGDE